ncbi:hypothetical protein CPLU01_01934 [Colletotrichum plurivorum]|uniref:Clr5 domain-containing protein n=1 Tax=Colletotrichum plurivorum TaxID=2175906 RepID=A0A8H6KXR5_9PEZI|nr:hypothetical protein CPLU01_01934 [Colletotrichum plurivorum]
MLSSKRGSRAPRRTTAEWEERKARICELYRDHSLSDVIDILREKEDFVVRLNNWAFKKYHTAEEDSEDSEDPEELQVDVNSLYHGEADKLNPLDRQEKQRFGPLPAPAISLRSETEPPVGSREDRRSFDDIIGKPQDGEKRLTDLMINYMHEAIASGTVFVDLEDPLAKGYRLFKWAND